MGKLDDVEHAEKKREADCNERIHHAEQQPAPDVLGKQPHIHDFMTPADPRARRLRREEGDGDDSVAPPPICGYFCPGNLRLPEAYSLSSHSTNLPSWITYLVMTGTVFWP